ncbi:MAG: hypothetical protein RAO94_00695 [Candidatus Stygibacter australis]|nr:hypothetical protein [Candidatus Stygibacter australis]
MKTTQMPLLSEILTRMDSTHDTENPRDPRRHTIAYSNTRTIIKYIASDVILLAYGCNPGNGIVIFKKNHGLIAYGCYLDSFPAGKDYPCYHWKSMSIEKAITRIKLDIWDTAGFLEEVDFIDAPVNEWQELACGEIEFTSYNSGNIKISDFMRTYKKMISSCFYSILRLKSGRLRVEIDGSYCPYEQLAEAIQFFRSQTDSRETTTGQLPRLYYWRKVLSVSDLDEEIFQELKVQTIVQKMSKAF